MTTVWFAGGGTGGHLMPALAIADAMVHRDPAIRPFFIGSLRGVESNVLPQRPWPYELLPLEPLRRRQWWKNTSLPLSLYRSVRRVKALLAADRPGLVVGTGGYVAGPVVWSAVRAGVPAVLQEQNAFPGIATRRLAPQVRQVHLGFPEARRFLRTGPTTEIHESGNPVLPPPDPRPAAQAARTRLGLAADLPAVLVVGGSQGALAVNLAVDAALSGGSWPDSLQLIWQTGAGTHDRFAHWDDGSRVLVRPFLDPMAEAYAAADLVISRAGAMTIAEICAWALPAILIPLPSAAAGHQLTNARALADSGAAVLLEQRSASGTTLSQEIRSLFSDPARMAALKAGAGDRGRPHAADFIASQALHILSTSKS